MKLLITSSIIFLILLTTVLADNNTTVSSFESLSFKDKVIFSPSVPFLWNFQRGVEELYRIVKFTSTMRVDYSLELGERRIGEMEVLIDKNESNIIQMVENQYEIEIDKVQSNMNSTDIFSKVVKPSDIKQNVTERLQYDEKVLGAISANVPKSTKEYIDNAIKKTSDCIDFINRL